MILAFRGCIPNFESKNADGSNLLSSLIAPIDFNISEPD